MFYADIEKMKKSTLILTETDPSTDMMFNAWIKNGLDAKIIFKPQKKAVRLVRRLWVDHFFPGYSAWYGDWKNEIEKYDTVILHASERTRTIPNYIHKIKPSMRIIYWYWNPVNKNTVPCLTKNSKIECWSFDQEDCLKYGFSKNIQYYYYLSENYNNILYDVYFVGHDKGRLKQLNNIKNWLEKKHVSLKADVIKENEKSIPYREVQKKIHQSKAILEILQKGQSGATLRTLESLFFQKKLITTNKNIKKENFYCKDNIFIVGIDSENKIDSFLSNPYNTVVNEYMNLYTIDSWFMNFFINGGN